MTNEKKYDIDNLTQRHLLYKQYVAWNCNGSSVAPLTEYMNNPIFQELPDEGTYFSLKNDDRVYLDLRASSGYKNIKTRKKRLKNKSTICTKTSCKVQTESQNLGILTLRVFIHLI